MPSVVMSGAYVGRELKKEFGRIPPALLPAGGRPVLSLIADSGFLRDTAFLVLPDDYELTAGEKATIERAGFETILTNPQLPVEAALSALPPSAVAGDLDLIFGDTLVLGTDYASLPANSYLVADAPVHYEWSFLVSEEPCLFQTLSVEDLLERPRGKVACGVFRFSDGASFQRCIRRSEDLAGALTTYAAKTPVTLVTTKGWIDFGHYDTYFHARRELLVARAHNDLTVDQTILEKRSSDVGKIEAECHWYEALPRELSDLTPRFYGPVSSAPGTSGYRLEYLPNPVLSELWVYGRRNHQHWHGIFREVLVALERLHSSSVERCHVLDATQVHSELWTNKLRHRVTALVRYSGWISEVHGLKNDLLSISEELLTGLAKARSSDLGLVHGDFFFGNLLFETRSRRVFMIDPRGQIGSQVTPFGDQRYDLAKLAMSVWFGYDQIIEGRYEFGNGPIGRRPLMRDHSEYEGATAKVFADYLETHGRSVEDITRAAAIVVLSLLPLHSEDPHRQEALIRSALDVLKNRSLL